MGRLTSCCVAPGYSTKTFLRPAPNTGMGDGFIGRVRDRLGGGSEDGASEILAVDDNDAALGLYETLLDETGYTYDTAGDGREALRKVGEDTRVVLLDRKMPGVPGDMVLEILRSDDIDRLDVGSFDDSLPRDAVRRQMNQKGIEDVSPDTVIRVGKDLVERVQELDLNCRVGIVTQVEPGFDTDAIDGLYITKDAGKDELLDSVEYLMGLALLDELRDEYESLTWNKEILEEKNPGDALKDNDRYRRITERLEEIEEERSELVDRIEEYDPRA